MKLIDLLVKELPKRGGFPEGANECVQDSDGTVKFFDSDSLSFGGYGWSGSARGKFYCTSEDKITGLALSCDYNSSIVTRIQYESALAASDGWIEWAGGDCPVDSDAIVEVRFRNQNHYQYNNDRAGDFEWEHIGSKCDIIAYRMQKPTKSEQVRADAWGAYAGIAEADSEANLNECIGQEAPEWNGEGLPPAGWECEAKYRDADNAEWFSFRCVGVDCGVAFGWAGKEAVTLGRGSYEFRPLRTESERKREDAIKAIKGLLMFDYGDDQRVNDATFIYDAIAAGKIPGVKLEEK